jgi:hypothetical protein
MLFWASFFETEDIGNRYFFLYLCWPFSLLVMTSVECQWLVYKHRIVHRHSEENLCGHQAIDIRLPDVKSNPQLGEKPQQPNQRNLPKHMFINIRQVQTQQLTSEVQQLSDRMSECMEVIWNEKFRWDWTRKARGSSHPNQCSEGRKLALCASRRPSLCLNTPALTTSLSFLTDT